ncbi:hypothetical protein ACOMHN_048888 [Nucella lapillus]
MSAAVSISPGLETFPAPSFYQKKVDDNSLLPSPGKDHSPPPGPGNASPKSSYSLGTRPAQLDGKVSVAEEVVLAMGIPTSIVELVKALRWLEHGTNFTDAMEFYAAAETLINHPEEQVRIAQLLEAEQAKKEKEIHNKVVGNKVKEAPTEVKPLKDRAQLKEKVKQLAEENHKLKKRKMCRACRKVDLASSGITFLPCGHFITCETCSEKFDDCPACSRSIMGTVRTYLS